MYSNSKGTIRYTTTTNNNKDTMNSNNYVDFTSSWRGLLPKTLKFFGVQYVPTEGTVRYPHGKDAYKVRVKGGKDFYWSGEAQAAPMFGSDKFSSAQSMTLTITEGQDDAMAVYQMMGHYPVVSVKSSGSAVKDISAQYDWVNSFDKIYLCFDNDKVGQKAAKQVAKLFDVNKVYHVQMDRLKDANEYLMDGAKGVKEFVSLWWNAKKIKPKGIVSSFDEIEKLLNKKDSATIAQYPFATLQEMTYGMREGESVLWKAQEKIGKTEVMRAIEHHVLKTTDHNIGIIHLEEEERRSIQGLAGYDLKRPVHLPDSGVSNADVMDAYRKLVKRDDRVYYYTHFGSDDPDIILGSIRYLAAVAGCKIIFLDHISMVVSGHKDDGDERRKLDRISTELAQMCRELNFNLQFISHVNDDGKTRGSRYISKAADLIITLDRNTEAEDPTIRNKTKLVIEGNRYASKSGPAGNLYFNPETFCLTELSDEEVVIEGELEGRF